MGYVQTAEGDWTLDPDTQVRERLDYAFDSFRRHGIVRAVVRDLKEQGLELPTRVTAKEGYGSLVWKAATLSAVIRILHNPAYAGAYVYGRWEYLSERRSPKTGKAAAHVRSVAQWPVNITAHHPAYLSWEEFVKNQERLRQNWSHEENRRAPREWKRPAAGSCLLWRPRPEDERSKPGSERQAVTFVYLRARLSGWRRQDLSKYDFTPR